MATRVAEAKPAGITGQRAGASGSVARLPILDMHGKAQGYELIFRDGEAGGRPAAGTAPEGSAHQSPEPASSGPPAFIDCPADLLAGDWLHAFPPASTVVQLKLESEVPPELIAACRDLKAKGYRLALKEFSGQPGSKPLAALADYIKVDFLKVGEAGRRDLIYRLGGHSIHLIAEGVETQVQFREACQEGFRLFQGYYFCFPEPVKNHRIPGNRLVHLEIMEDLQSDPVDLNRLGQLVMCDASLVYRLLRLVNSPVSGMRQEVTSIQTALLLVGETTFRRMAMLAIAIDFNADQPAELLRMAFVRARFCETAASLCGLVPSEQYLVGMVSLFPAMLRILMEDMVSLVPLRAEARDALLGHPAREGILLQWAIFQEHGNWAACDQIIRANGLDAGNILKCHDEALAWADAALKSNA
jgi:EAL and modified HD-GYP domain-containing signal transduction protein